MISECARSGSFKIPPELLCEIFKRLGFRDRVQATHICKYWRNASLDHPGALWSAIRSDGARTGALAAQLVRTRDVPVDVVVRLKDDTLDEVMTVISSHLHHIRSLVLYSAALGEGEVSMENIHTVYQYLAHPAPILEELEIALAIPDDHPDSWSMDDRWERWMRRKILSFDYTLAADLFDGHAPRLRKAAWLVMELNIHGCAALSGLTRFAFEGRRISASHLSVIVNCLPQLKCLLIESQDLEGLPDSPRPPTFLLDELYLDIPDRSGHGTGEQNILPLLEYLGYRRIPRVTTYRFDTWLDRFTASLRGLPRVLHLDAVGFLTMPYWHMADERGFISRGLHVPAHEMLDTPLGKRLFENVESLVIETHVLINDRAFPPLPRLSHLCIRIRDRGPTHSSSETTSGPILTCPSLQVMEIWWDTSEPPQVLDVISRGLAFCLGAVSHPADPPLHVILRGATVSTEDVPQSLCRVTVSSEPVPRSFVAERGSRWQVLTAE